jgi:hypothetical protein
MGERERGELALPEQPPDRPGVVEEAHDVLNTYAWQLLGTGALGTAVWGVGLRFGAPLPPWWLAVFLAALVLLYFVPVTRAPKLAREVLRRWDELRVERALARSGLSDDPRLEVADAMAARIIRHPAVAPDVHRTAEDLLHRLQLLLADLRRVEWLGRTTSMEGGRHIRSISDLQDVLDARVASMLAQLAELHRTVVLRDAVATERALASVQELLASLEVEEEVDRLLADAEERTKE